MPQRPSQEITTGLEEESADSDIRTQIGRRTFINRFASGIALSTAMVLIPMSIPGCSKKSKIEQTQPRERSSGIETLKVQPPKIQQSKKITIDRPSFPANIDPETINRISSALSNKYQDFFSKLKVNTDKKSINAMFVNEKFIELVKIFKDIINKEIPGFLDKNATLTDDHDAMFRLINEILALKNRYFYASDDQIDLFTVKERRQIDINGEFRTEAIILDRGYFDYESGIMGLAYQNNANNLILWPHRSSKIIKNYHRWLTGAKEVLSPEIMERNMLEDTIYHESIHLYNQHKFALVRQTRQMQRKARNRDVSKDVHHILQKNEDLLINLDEMVAIGAELSQLKLPIAFFEYIDSSHKYYKFAKEYLRKYLMQEIRNDRTLNQSRIRNVKDAVKYMEVLVHTDLQAALRIIQRIGLKVFQEGISALTHLKKKVNK